jgi:hypothetical protein
MREFREYDEVEEPEKKRKRMTHEEREEFLEKHRMMSEEERASFIRELIEETKVDFHPEDFEEFASVLDYKQLEKIQSIRKWLAEHLRDSDVEIKVRENEPKGPHKILHSIEDLNQSIHDDSEVRTWGKFDREYRNATAFIKLRELKESGKTHSMTLTEIADEIGADKQKVSVWQRRIHVPRLIVRYEGHPKDRLNSQITIRGFSDIIDMIQENPHTQESPDFSERLVQSWVFIQYKRFLASGKKSEFTYGELSDIFGVNPHRLHIWNKRNEIPILVNSLIIQEVARRQYQDSFEPLSERHRIDYKDVYAEFAKVRERGYRSTEKLSKTIEQLYRGVEEPPRMIFAELSHYHQTGPRWLREVAQQIELYQVQIEDNLNYSLRDRLGERETFRIGVVNHTLYIWRKETDPFTWLNLFSNELFYFSAKDKKDIHRNALAHLNLG